MTAEVLDRAPTRSDPPAEAPRGWRPLVDGTLSAWLCLGLLVTTMFAGQADLFGLPIGPHRILLVLTLVALFNERVGRFRRPRPRSIHVAMIATVLWATGSAIWVGNLGTDYGVFALVDRLVVPYLGFVIAPAVFSTPQRRDLLLKCLLLVGIYLGATAYFEIIGPSSLVFPSMIMDPTLGAWGGRARGPFLGSEANGMVLLICAFAAWYGVQRLHWLWRPISLACLGLASLGCLLTLTRSVWLGFGVALAVVALRDATLRKWLPVAGVVVAGGLVAALTLLPAMGSIVEQRLGTESSVYDRISTNAAALRMVQEHPLTGVGWLRFVDENGEYVRQGDTLPIGYTKIEVHNVLLGRAAELGLIGCALWVLTALLGPLRVLVQRAAPDGRRPGVVTRVLGRPHPTGWWTVAAAAACSWAVTVMTSPLPYPLPNLLVFMLAGMVLADHED